MELTHLKTKSENRSQNDLRPEISIGHVGLSVNNLQEAFEFFKLVGARGLMNGLALDHGRLDIDSNTSEVAQAIRKDVEDGQTLKVQATPEFIVNGRRMPSFGYKQLSLLVKEAVDEAYPE